MSHLLRYHRPNSLSAACFITVVLIGAFAVPAHAQRERWQNVDGIFAALRADSGDTIADIGAGDGFFALRLGPLVGSAGLVLAVDIDSVALRRLQRTAQRMSVTNVRTLLSEPDDPKLQPGSLDGVLIVISYHEFTEHEAMLAGIRRALKPDARLVIVDNVAWDGSSSRSTQMQRHHMDIGLVEADLRAAGFEIIERVPEFIDVELGDMRRRQWMLVAVVGDRFD